MITNMKHIKNKLEAKKVKPTYQRLCVLEYLEKNMNHPTAEMIYENISKRIPTMSKTTIYNTLNLFLENGLLHAVTITGTELRYDINTSSHHHFLCRKCGKIVDIEVKCPFCDGEITQIDGNEIEEIHGYFKGICKECREKNNKVGR